MTEAIARIEGRVHELDALLGPPPVSPPQKYPLSVARNGPKESFGAHLKPASNLPLYPRSGALSNNPGPLAPRVVETPLVRGDVPAEAVPVDPEERKRREKYLPLIREAAARTGVPEALIAAVIQAESSYKPETRSSAGAMGLMQLMPDNVKEFGVGNPYDPQENILAGARHLRQMIDRFGTLEKALAAYNAGPGKVDRYGGVPPYRETQDYVRRITEMLRKAGALPESGSMTPVVNLPPAAPPAALSAPTTAGDRSFGALLKNPDSRESLPHSVERAEKSERTERTERAEKPKKEEKPDEATAHEPPAAPVVPPAPATPTPPEASASVKSDAASPTPVAPPLPDAAPETPEVRSIAPTTGAPPQATEAAPAPVEPPSASPAPTPTPAPEIQADGEEEPEDGVVPAVRTEKIERSESADAPDPALETRLEATAPEPTPTEAPRAPEAARPATESGPTPAPTAPPDPESVTQAALSQRVSQLAQAVRAGGKSELRVRLDPPNLGHVRVSVEGGADGVAIRVVAESRETMLLLQDQRGPLHEALRQSEVALGSFSASTAGGDGASGGRAFGGSAQFALVGSPWRESAEGAPAAISPLSTLSLDARA